MKKIVVVNDTHVARVWDKIDNILPKEANLLNPNKVLKQLLTEIDDDSTLLFNGDLVDYGYVDYLGGGATNWDYFFEILDEFKGDRLLNVGNHDYRKLPYNFSLYGMEHVNIDWLTYLEHEHAIGYGKFRWFKELESIGVSRKKSKIIPDSITLHPQGVKYGHGKLLLLDTRSDSVVLPSLFEKRKNWPFILTRHPSSMGIPSTHLDFLARELESHESGEELIVFMHCPLFFADKEIEAFKLEKQKYGKEIRTHKLNHSTFLRNNWNMLEKLVHSDANVIVITAHSHLTGQYIVDKATKELRQSSMKEINTLRKDARYIKFITNLPLGAIRHPEKRIGYLVIDNDSIEYKVIRDFNDC